MESEKIWDERISPRIDEEIGKKSTISDHLSNECICCEEGMPKGECPDSKRECGHHCNHSWIHDECCWCGEEFVCENDNQNEE